tara:strand:+ start:111392 stop:112291 length:900 start_codon:yes stop_codon:yes gene_type:complete
MVRATSGTAKLLHFEERKKNHAAPVVLVPSLVNPPHILDLSRRMSLMRYLADQGHDPWLVDWGHPAAEDASLSLADHVEQRLLPLLRETGRPPLLVGYCLGGTLALAAAQLLRQTVGVATIASPWDFDQYPTDNRALIANLWREAKPLCEKLGYVPMEVLQSGFWALDPQRTIRKYAAFADSEEGSDAEQAFIAVEDWANQGAPLTFAAARDLFEGLYEGNLSGTGQWTVGKEIVAPHALACPTFSIRSTTDRIVPAAAAPPLQDRHDSALGHVGMIVSAKAPGQIWGRLSQWLSNHGG